MRERAQSAVRELFAHADVALWLAAMTATVVFAYRERAHPSPGGGSGFIAFARDPQQQRLVAAAFLAEVLGVAVVAAATARVRHHGRALLEASVAAACVAITVATIGLYWPTLESYPADVDFVQRPAPWPEVQESQHTRFTRTLRTSEASVVAIDGAAFRPHEPHAVVSAFRADGYALQFLGEAGDLLFDVVADSEERDVEAFVGVFPSPASAGANAAGFVRRHRFRCDGYADHFRLLRRANVIVNVRSGCAPERLPAAAAALAGALRNLPSP